MPLSVTRLALPDGALVRVYPEDARRYPGGVALGGDQSWFEHPLARKTCCGSVSMVNVILSFSRKSPGIITQSEYIDFYHSCFPRSRPLSGFMPFAKGYARIARKMLSRLGVNVSTRCFGNFTASPGQALLKIASSISSGVPVALQNWFGCEKPVRPFHWVTVTGIDADFSHPERSILHVSSWGRLYDYPLSHAWRGKASIVLFKINAEA